MIRKLFGVLVLVIGLSGAAYAGLLNGNANLVLGQSDFVTRDPGLLDKPYFVKIDDANSRVFVSDTLHNRVLWWNTVSGFSNGASPSGILGQDVITSTQANRGGTVGPTTLKLPTGIAVDGSGNIWVADTGNNLIVRYSSTLATGMAADRVLGQADLNSANGNRGGINLAANSLWRPAGIAIDASGNLWVADCDNHRILRFPAPLTNDESADLVLGQPNMTTVATYSGDHSSGANIVGATTLYYPQGVFVDSAGSVWVADHMNHRFLNYSGALSNGMPATLVLGQTDFSQGRSNRASYATAGTIYCSFSVAVDRSGNAWVADFTNNRILRYSPPLANGMGASQVIGQNDFSTVLINRGAGIAGAQSLNYPSSVEIDSAGNLWVAELGNNRVLKYNAAGLTAIVPSIWHNGGKKEFVISGQGLVNGITVKLTKAGHPDIVGSNAAASGDESQMTCVFDLTGAAAGPWDLVLSAGNISTTLPGAVTIRAVKATAVSPTRAINDRAVDVVITGENFFAGIEPRLSKAGSDDVPGQFVTVVSSTQVNCRFDILDVTTGYWNVVAAAGVPEATLVNAFDVHFPSSVARMILRQRRYHLGMEAEKAIMTFDIPAGTFARDTFFTADVPAALPPLTETNMRASDVAVEVLNDQKLQPRLEMGIGFYYNDPFVAGLNKGRLAACYCDDPTGRWIPVNSRANAAGCCVLSKTKHLCIFRLVELLPSSDLSGIKVYPNPYTPGSGGMHDEAALGKGVVFAGLTANARVKIFTIAGELVRDLSETNGDGVLVWDAKNDRGETAASGTYIYLIVNGDDDGEKKRGKFAIIR
jgi:sugar lactone lactonase YvrE